MSITTDSVTEALSGKQSINKASNKNVASGLGIAQFLQLMSTQLKNQDPFKPLDSTAFVAQLAQFGTVSGIQSMNDSLATLTQSLRSSQALSGATLVGHEILTAADTAHYSGAQAIVGAVQVPAGAQAVQLTVSDSSGQAIKHIGLTNVAGLQQFAWNGTDDAGNAVAAGNYKFTVMSGTGSDSQALATQLYGSVSSVSIDAQSASLTLNTPELGSVALSAVSQVN